MTSRLGGTGEEVVDLDDLFRKFNLRDSRSDIANDYFIANNTTTSNPFGCNY